jgi:AcrR family transcriptional regulator
MPSARQEPERDAIAAAMVDLCVELRYPNVELSMVLLRAGVDEATFKQHFANLEDCFCQIFEANREDIVARIAAAWAVEEGWRERMRSAAKAMLAYFFEDLQRARFMNVEVLYAGDRAKLLRDQAMQGFALLIDQGREEMEDPDALTPFTAEVIASSIYQRIQSALERDELDEFENAIPEMMYMAVLPYLGSKAAQEELTIPSPPFRRG